MIVNISCICYDIVLSLTVHMVWHMILHMICHMEFRRPSMSWKRRSICPARCSSWEAVAFQTRRLRRLSGQYCRGSRRSRRPRACLRRSPGPPLMCNVLSNRLEGITIAIGLCCVLVFCTLIDQLGNRMLVFVGWYETYSSNPIET